MIRTAFPIIGLDSEESNGLFAGFCCLFVLGDVF